MRRLAVLLALMLLLCGCSTASAPEPLPPSPYTPADFSWDGAVLKCDKGGTVQGIDVSSHQGQIDWQQVANAGVRFVFVRLGYRGYNSGTLHMDDFAGANLRGAKEAGLKVGAYFFSQAVNAEEAKEEAEYALEILEGFPLDLPLVYDWEFVSLDARTGKVDGGTMTKCAKVFCGEAARAGYAPGMYFNSDQAKKLDLYAFSNYPWWLAKYDETMNFVCRVDLWQYSNTGSVPGINGNVDLDLMFTDYGLGKEVFGG